MLTPARLRGGVYIDPPHEQNFVTFLLANSIACRFLRKNMNGCSNFCDKKKFEKKYVRGSPEASNMAKI